MVVDKFLDMPLEYVGYEHFLVKTDVFSFGVLVLEIAGRRTRNFVTLANALIF